MLEVLKILRAHGIDGSVCIFLINPINLDKPLYNKNGQSFKLDRINKKQNIIKISGISDRDVAEALKGTILYQEKDQLKENEFYVSDLIGKIIVVNGKNEHCEIGNIVNYGGGELAELIYNHQKILIPFRKEYFKDDLSIDYEILKEFL